MKNQISFALLVAFGLASAGCAHKGAYTPRNAAIADLENSQPFVLMDSGAQRSVTLGGPIQEGINADGRLEVVANIRNRENRRIQVQVNCVFKDAQGFSTGDETPWKTLILTENSQEAVSFVAMNDKAKRYTIRVRQAR